MGLSRTHWDALVLKACPGARILDSRLDEAGQERRYLVCREGRLFYLTLSHGSNAVREEALNRYVRGVRCVIGRKRR